MSQFPEGAKFPLDKFRKRGILIFVIRNVRWAIMVTTRAESAKLIACENRWWVAKSHHSPPGGTICATDEIWLTYESQTFGSPGSTPGLRTSRITAEGMNYYFDVTRLTATLSKATV